MAGGTSKEQNYWPGFVDALSNLVLVVILVLVIFTVSLFFFASRVGVKVKEAAELKAKEVVAKTASVAAPTPLAPNPKLQQDNNPIKGAQANTLQDANSAQIGRGTERLQSSAVAQKLLNDIKQQIASESLSAQTQGQLLQKIAELERDLQANATASATLAGEPQAPSEIQTRTEFRAEKTVSDTPKGSKILPGRGGQAAGEVAIVTYNPSVVEGDALVYEGLDKSLASLGDLKKLRFELLAQPSDESYSEAQRLSYYRLIGLRNYLLKKGVASDRVQTRIIERSANPEFKLGTVFVRAAS